MSTALHFVNVPGIGCYPGPVLLVPEGVQKVTQVTSEEVCVGTSRTVDLLSYRPADRIYYRRVIIGLPEKNSKYLHDNTWLKNGKFYVFMYDGATDLTAAQLIERINSELNYITDIEERRTKDVQV